MSAENRFSELLEKGSFSMKENGLWDGSSEIKQCVNEIRASESSQVDGCVAWSGWGDSGGSCVAWSGWSN